MSMPKTEAIGTVAVAGTGNVGWHMAKAFHEAGISVSYILSGHLETARIVAGECNALSLEYSSELDSPPDLILLCVPDRYIPEFISRYAGMDSIIAHTSGSTGTDAFKGKTNKFGVFYPLQTFSRKINLNYKEIPFFIEGSDSTTATKLIQLAGRISNTVHEADSQTRKLLHISAVFSCNFSNHLSAISYEIFKNSEIDFRVLLPLLKQTIAKLSETNPVKAQTGPAVRGDLEIINEHLNFLADYPEEKEIYRLISDNIMRYKKFQDE